MGPLGITYPPTFGRILCDWITWDTEYVNEKKNKTDMRIIGIMINELIMWIPI